MDPMTIAAILQGVGAVGTGASGLFGQQPEVPQPTAWETMMGTNALNMGNLQNIMYGGLSPYQYGGNLTDLGMMYGYDPSTWGLTPEVQQQQQQFQGVTQQALLDAATRQAVQSGIGLLPNKYTTSSMDEMVKYLSQTGNVPEDAIRQAMQESQWTSSLMEGGHQGKTGLTSTMMQDILERAITSNYQQQAGIQPGQATTDMGMRDLRTPETTGYNTPMTTGKTPGGLPWEGFAEVNVSARQVEDWLKEAGGDVSKAVEISRAVNTAGGQKGVSGAQQMLTDMMGKFAPQATQPTQTTPPTSYGGPLQPAGGAVPRLGGSISPGGAQNLYQAGTMPPGAMPQTGGYAGAQAPYGGSGQAAAGGFGGYGGIPGWEQLLASQGGLAGLGAQQQMGTILAQLGLLPQQTALTSQQLQSQMNVLPWAEGLQIGQLGMEAGLLPYEQALRQAQMGTEAGMVPMRAELEAGQIGQEQRLMPYQEALQMAQLGGETGITPLRYGLESAQIGSQQQLLPWQTSQGISGAQTDLLTQELMRQYLPQQYGLMGSQTQTGLQQEELERLLNPQRYGLESSQIGAQQQLLPWQTNLAQQQAQTGMMEQGLLQGYLPQQYGLMGAQAQTGIQQQGLEQMLNPQRYGVESQQLGQQSALIPAQTRNALQQYGLEYGLQPQRYGVESQRLGQQSALMPAQTQLRQNLLTGAGGPGMYSDLGTDYGQSRQVGQALNQTMQSLQNRGLYGQDVMGKMGMEAAANIGAQYEQQRRNELQNMMYSGGLFS